MSGPARLVVRVAALLGAALLATVAALALAGCGSTTAPDVEHSAASLCVAVDLPLTGSDATVARLVAKGVHGAIPSRGVDVNGYRIHVCGESAARSKTTTTTAATSAIHDRDYDAAAPAPRSTRASTFTGSSGQLLRTAVGAASDPRAIAFIGALDGTEATEADAVLAPASIPLIAPSAPPGSGTLTLRQPSRSGAGPGQEVRPTAFFLLPTSSAQTRAEQAVVNLRACASLVSGVRTNLHKLIRCFVVGSPLCTDPPIGPAYVGAPLPVYCVAPGSDLQPADAPAEAYGYAAAELLITTLKQIAASGGDIADRQVVLNGLAETNLRTSAIGPVRFSSTGEILGGHFSLYTVTRQHRLVLSQAFTTH